MRRTDREKVFVPLDQLETAIAEQLEIVRKTMYDTALARRESMTYTAMWCGDQACEEKLKEVAGVSSRCMPFEQEHLADTCVCCGKPAKTMVYWGKAY